MSTVTESMEENQQSPETEKRKAAPRPGKLTAQEKARLRHDLPKLLERAHSSPEAARAALDACLKLRYTVPTALLTKENIASTLSLGEIARTLDFLSTSETTLDVSAGLAAIQVLANRDVGEPSERKALFITTRAVTSRLNKIAKVAVKKGATSQGSQPGSGINFAGTTLSSATDLALLMLNRLLDPQSIARRSVYPQARSWVQVVELIWRRTLAPGAPLSVFTFLRSLQRVIPKGMYADLKAEPSLNNFFHDAEQAFIQQAGTALIEGRLKELERSFSIAMRDETTRNQILSELRALCQSRASELVPEAVEWVARQIELETPKLKSPTAADDSQSSALDYVAVCLLTAWDASADGNRSALALQSIQRLARDVYKVDLIGVPGQEAVYSDREHELQSHTDIRPVRVEVIRPGVRWSDGIRTRFLVRSVVKAIA